MLSLLEVIMLGKILFCTSLGFVYYYIYHLYKEHYMRLWALSWLLYSSRLVLEIFRFDGYDAAVWLLLNQAVTMACVVFLLLGIYNFAGRKIPTGWIYTCALATLLSDLAILLGLSVTMMALPTALYFGTAQIWTGVMFIRLWALKGPGKYVTGYAFIILGLANSLYPFSSAIISEYTIWAFLSASVLDFIIIIGTLLVYFQKVRSELSKSEKLFRLLAENARDIVYRYRHLPVPRFEYVSPSVMEITGYTQDDFYRDPALPIKIAHPEDRRLAERLGQLVEPGGKPVEMRLIHKDNRLVWTEHNMVVVQDRHGNPKAVEGIIRDITGRKHMEQHITHLGQLRIMGEMAATIAHEIRTPMTTVHGYLQILAGKKELAGQRKYLHIMLDELERADTILAEYLKLSKSKKSKLTCQSLNSIIRYVFPLVRAGALNEGKDVRLELDDIPEQLLDSNETKQLLLNLARNGLDAMEGGGVLVIRTYVEVNEIVLAVEDRGKGIDPAVLDKLGTPFTTTREDGTGLGLSVCLGIAERHGAKITVQSSPGKTTFFVWYPVPENTSARPALQRAAD